LTELAVSPLTLENRVRAGLMMEPPPPNEIVDEPVKENRRKGRPDGW